MSLFAGGAAPRKCSRTGPFAFRADCEWRVRSEKVFYLASSDAQCLLDHRDRTCQRNEKNTWTFFREHSVGQLSSVIQGRDPFDDDRRSQQEGERRLAYERCKRNLKKDAWQAVSGRRDGQPASRWDAPESAANHYQDENCQPGPWKPPSQTPANNDPGLKLTSPGDLKWKG